MLAVLAAQLECGRCGAAGAANNIILTAAPPRPRARRLVVPALNFQILLGIPGALAAGGRAVGALARYCVENTVAIVRVIAALTAAAVLVAAAWFVVLGVGVAIGVPAKLVIAALDYEYRDNLRNSPAGGYRERVERRHRE